MLLTFLITDVMDCIKWRTEGRKPGMSALGLPDDFELSQGKGKVESDDEDDDDDDDDSDEEDDRGKGPSKPKASVAAPAPLSCEKPIPIIS